MAAERQYCHSRIRQKVKHQLAVSKHSFHNRIIQFDFSLKEKKSLDLLYDMVFQPHDRPILVSDLSGVSKQKTFSNLKLGGIVVGELTPT